MTGADTLDDSGGQFVRVRRQWNDWRKAKYRLEDLEHVHWSYMSGGVQAPTPRPFMHAYVRCDAAVEGEVAHSGTHGPCPHSIKVCIVQKDNSKSVIEALKRIAS